jgi:hypothetical protein
VETQTTAGRFIFTIIFEKHLQAVKPTFYIKAFSSPLGEQNSKFRFVAGLSVQKKFIFNTIFMQILFVQYFFPIFATVVFLPK